MMQTDIQDMGEALKTLLMQQKLDLVNGEKKKRWLSVRIFLGLYFLIKIVSRQNLKRTMFVIL